MDLKPLPKEIAEDSRLHPLVEHANELLRDKIAPANESVTASWSRVDSKGWDLLTLDLLDSATGDRGTTVFNANELINDEYLLKRLHGVWGDLLRGRSHRLYERLVG
jgi:hypothetical protein